MMEIMLVKSELKITEVKVINDKTADVLLYSCTVKTLILSFCTVVNVQYYITGGKITKQCQRNVLGSDCYAVINGKKTKKSIAILCFSSLSYC